MSAQARFIHISFAFTSAPPIDALKEVFNTALDWIRYSSHGWILYSTTELDTWRDRIRNAPGIQESDAFFICEFSSGEYSGYMDNSVWEFIAKHIEN